jgi:hypothetical protein
MQIYMCPHTTYMLHLASQSVPWVLILLAITICVPILLCVSPSFFPAPFVSLKYYVRLLTLLCVWLSSAPYICVLSYFYMCPHTTMFVTWCFSPAPHVSAYYYHDMCPHTTCVSPLRGNRDSKDRQAVPPSCVAPLSRSICVLILLCVLILVCMCSHITLCVI